MIESLAVLGTDSADQLAWIDKHKVVTDELALEFDRVIGPGHFPRFTSCDDRIGQFVQATSVSRSMALRRFLSR